MRSHVASSDPIPAWMPGKELPVGTPIGPRRENIHARRENHHAHPADTMSEPLPPPAAPIDPASLLRPETLRLMHDIAFTSAVTECPVNLTREEIHALLELMESRSTMAHDWVQSLQWGLCYARITQRLAERQGFGDYARWIERHRIEPMLRMRDELTQEGTDAPPLNPPFARVN